MERNSPGCKVLVRMTAARNRQSGFSLIELLIVVALMGILAGVVIPSATPAIYDQLQSAAQVVASDLAYARSLAVMNNSKYRLRFSRTENRYVLEHSGTDTSLNTLPSSAFRSPQDPPHQHTTDLDQLPQLGIPISLIEVQAMSTTPTRVSNLEFGEVGETTRPQDTIIWLAAGAGSERRYMTVEVNHATGLAIVGDFTAAAPPSASGPALP